jgi:hypothetical protein
VRQLAAKVPRRPFGSTHAPMRRQGEYRRRMHCKKSAILKMSWSFSSIEWGTIPKFPKPGISGADTLSIERLEDVPNWKYHAQFLEVERENGTRHG